MWQVATGISVTFDKNGGETEANPNRMTQEQNPNGNHFELPSVQPTREGYEFTGWNTKADGTGAAFTAETEVRQSLTVYAQWTRKQIEKEDTISVTVKKVWKLNDGGKATDSVTVALYKNGNMDRTAVLNDANRWTYTWDDLSAKDAWTVEEPEVPNGFKTVVERKGSVFTITNDEWFRNHPMRPQRKRENRIINGCDRRIRRRPWAGACGRFFRANKTKKPRHRARYRGFLTDKEWN